MALTQKWKRDINKFFDDNERLKECFIKLFEHANYYIFDLIVDYRESVNLIGFKGETEPALRIYIVKRANSYRITIKECIKSEIFVASELKQYIKHLNTNLGPLVKEKDTKKEKQVKTSNASSKPEKVIMDPELEKVALQDEQNNAKKLYKAIYEEKSSLEDCLPMRGLTFYTTGDDYDDIERIQGMKFDNQRTLEKISEWSLLYNQDKLYLGHTRYEDEKEFFFLDSVAGKSKNLYGGTSLVNVNDANYNSVVREWHSPKKGIKLLFSRNVDMDNRQVKSVEILYDSSNNLYSNILDHYLRAALMRNKGKKGINSIIQTIQDKQDDIRTLDKDTSFIVQGCAGSGKTVVLLHRIRYLLYNNYVKDSEFVLLVPTETMKNYLSSTTNSLKIDNNRIFSFANYYAFLINEKIEEDVLDESVFSKAYLETIYSVDFLKTILASFLAEIESRVNKLVVFCEDEIANQIEESKQSYKNDIEELKKRKVIEMTAMLDVIKDEVAIPTEFDAIDSFIALLKKTYDDAKVEFDKGVQYVECPDLEEKVEELVVENPGVSKLREVLTYEEERIKNSPFFLRNAHIKKAEAIREQLENDIHAIREKVREIEKKKALKEFVDNYKVLGISLSTLEEKINEIKTAYDNACREVEDINENIDSVVDEYEEEIEAVDKLVQESIKYSKLSSDAIINLSNITHVVDYINSASKLYNVFAKNGGELSQSKKSEFNLFAGKTINERDNQLFVILFNKVKRAVKGKYNILICPKYKHYWFLRAYCKYLVKGASDAKASSYIFIDETQDLSGIELDLIRKYNTKKVLKQKILAK